HAFISSNRESNRANITTCPTLNTSDIIHLDSPNSGGFLLVVPKNISSSPFAFSPYIMGNHSR
ncbi:hypothetical protein ACTGXK_11985, partial [Streptococcus suis]